MCRNQVSSPPPEAPPDLVDLGVLAALDGPLGLMLALADATDRGWSRYAYLDAVWDRAKGETRQLALIRRSIDAQQRFD